MVSRLSTHQSRDFSTNQRRVRGLRHPDFIGFVTATLTYFGLVFGVGFILGVVRVFWIVPIAGMRNAELLEQPLMLAAIFLIARWTIKHPARELSRVDTLRMGLVALLILILAEVLVALFINPDRPRDTVSGIVYLMMLGIFGLMPWFLSTLGKRKR
jgi:hypothetical protein